MIPKTTDHYIQKRSELMRFFMNSTQNPSSRNKTPTPVDQIQACNRIEKFQQLLTTHSMSFLYYKSDKNQLKTRINSEISEKLQSHKTLIEKEQETQKQAENCIKLHEKLAVLREEFIKSEVEKFEQEDEEQERLKVVEKEEAKKEREAREKKKAEIEKYRIGRSLGKVDGNFVRELEENRLREEVKELEPRNLERVNYRRFCTVEKEHQKLNKKIGAQMEKLASQEKLERLRQEVRDELKIDEIRFDSERLVADTKSSLGKVKGGYSGDGMLNDEEIVSLFPLQTFTSAKVMNDPRMKLESALRSAGVNMTGDYAKSAMGRFQTTEPRQMVSSVFRNDR